MGLLLSGGDTENDIDLKRSEVNHLRLVLGWLRCEYNLDEHTQQGIANAAKMLVDKNIATQEKMEQMLVEEAAKIRHVPHYVRHGVKMLTKALREHEKRGDIVDGEVMKNRLEAR